MTSKRYAVFSCLNVLGLVFALILLIESLIGLFAKPNLEVVQLFFDYSPVESFYGLAAVSIFVIITSALAIFSLRNRYVNLFGCYLFLSLLLLAAFVFATTYALIYVKGGPRSGFQNIDKIIKEAVDNYESDLVDKAFQDPKRFLLVQNVFSCCGVNMESTYEPAANEVLLSAERCTLNDDILATNGIAEISFLKSAFPTFNETVQKLADSNPLLNKPDFFCGNVLFEQVEKLNFSFAIQLIVVSGIQFLCLFIVVSILCLKSSENWIDSEEDNRNSNRKRKNFRMTFSQAELSVLDTWRTRRNKDVIRNGDNSHVRAEEDLTRDRARSSMKRLWYSFQTGANRATKRLSGNLNNFLFMEGENSMFDLSTDPRNDQIQNPLFSEPPAVNPPPPDRAPANKVRRSTLRYMDEVDSLDFQFSDYDPDDDASTVPPPPYEIGATVAQANAERFFDSRYF